MQNKFDQYKHILLKWQQSVNLISGNTIGEFEERHLKDSTQLTRFISSDSNCIIDIGTGAGLPGIPVALESNFPTYLIESDRKKCTFLEHVILQLNLEKVRVINKRVEDAIISNPISSLTNSLSPTITARALANVEKIFTLVHSLLENNNISQYRLLLLKGANVEQEIIEASKDWEFTYAREQSETNNASSILIIDSFQKKKLNK